jgi:hypothetical protein
MTRDFLTFTHQLELLGSEIKEIEWFEHVVRVRRQRCIENVDGENYYEAFTRKSDKEISEFRYDVSYGNCINDGLWTGLTNYLFLLYLGTLALG